MTFHKLKTAGTLGRVPAVVLAAVGIWWILQFWLYPVTVARYFPLLLDHLDHPTGIFSPAYVFPVENYLLWELLRIFRVRTLSTLILFHFVVLVLLVCVSFGVLHRSLSPSQRLRGMTLFLLSPFAFTAGVLHLPNNEGPLFLLMVLAWCIRQPWGRAALGFLLGWTHYPTAFLGWMAWMVTRRKRPGISEGALLAGIVLGWITLRVYLTRLGVPPDSRLQFFALWWDRIFLWGGATLPLWIWSMLGPLWLLLPRLSGKRRRRWMGALGIALLGSALAMDRTRIVNAVLLWPVLDGMLADPEVLDRVDDRLLRVLVGIWVLWPFTYVWENHILLPYLGFRTLPF